MIGWIRSLEKKLLQRRSERTRRNNIKTYLKNGRIPWSIGYHEYRSGQIAAAIHASPQQIDRWARGLDERIVEIPWIFNQLSKTSGKLLDAGSSLNHDYILDHALVKNKDLTICTYYPESFARLSQRISYVFADLRSMPFRDGWFDEIACISTLEHIDMDNSMYGYEAVNAAHGIKKSYSYLLAVAEMVRVLKNGGRLLITVPFGKFENHGFFQQFDEDMIVRLTNELTGKGSWETTFFKYLPTGWTQSILSECLNAESFNPHTGIGKKDDGAAHSRAIGCIAFTKKT